MKPFFHFIFLFCCVTSFSQDKVLSFGTKFNSFKLQESRTKEIRAILGEPDSTNEWSNIACGGGISFYTSALEMFYQRLDSKIVLAAHNQKKQKKKVLIAIVFGKNSPIVINDTLTLSNMNMDILRQTFGKSHNETSTKVVYRVYFNNSLTYAIFRFNKNRTFEELEINEEI